MLFHYLVHVTHFQPLKRSSTADVLPITHSAFCGVLSLAQGNLVFVYLLSAHDSGIVAVGPRSYEADAPVMDVKLGCQDDGTFVAVDLGLGGLLCLGMPLVAGFEDFPSIKNVGIAPEHAIDTIGVSPMLCYLLNWY